MLEAERAGAKALVVFMDAYSRNSEEWKVLRRIQADEAHNCVLIGELLKRAGEDYSHATGEFYDKAVAVKGNRQRFGESLPRLSPAAREVLTRMRDSHLRSIAACEKVAGLLPK